MQNGYQGSSKPELRGKDEWVQVSWDTALGLTAKAILDTIEKHGNEGCFSSSYGGWSHAGIFRPNVLQGRFFNLLGGSSMTTGDYSAGAGQVVLPMVIGDMEVYSAQSAWETLRDNTELVSSSAATRTRTTASNTPCATTRCTAAGTPSRKRA